MKVFNCTECPKRIKCKLQDKKDQLKNKYGKSVIYKNLLGLLSTKGSNFEIGFNVGIYVGSRHYAWQQDLGQDIINDLKECISE